MKITKRQLKRIIREEHNKVLQENTYNAELQQKMDAIEGELFDILFDAPGGLFEEYGLGRDEQGHPFWSPEETAAVQQMFANLMQMNNLQNPGQSWE